MWNQNKVFSITIDKNIENTEGNWGPLEYKIIELTSSPPRSSQFVYSSTIHKRHYTLKLRVCSGAILAPRYLRLTFLILVFRDEEQE